MKVQLTEITVRELTKNYVDNYDEGVVGYDGKLDIRPPYQREFVYKDAQRDAVIDTIVKNFPLNVMYWAVWQEKQDGHYEIIDGQQRTISICQYVSGDFAFEKLYFHNLQDDQKKQILDYKLMIYQCSGTNSEKLQWFKTINIAGEKLTNQELRNAVYSGSWISDAKRYFSKTGCVAYKIGSSYVAGSPIRQEYLQTVIKWISHDDIEGYMGQHQHRETADELWQYFRDVVKWIETNFVKKRKFMKTVNWGVLYNRYKDTQLDPDDIERQTAALILDDDVTKKSGIYPYILTKDEKYLSVRVFTTSMKQKVYEKQNSICIVCDKEFKIDEMEADHIIPWSKGGKTIENNCQMLCQACNRQKSGK